MYRRCDWDNEENIVTYLYIVAISQRFKKHDVDELTDVKASFSRVLSRICTCSTKEHIHTHCRYSNRALLSAIKYEVKEFVFYLKIYENMHMRLSLNTLNKANRMSYATITANTPKYKAQFYFYCTVVNYML